MVENLDKVVKTFISKYWYYNIDKLISNTTLDEIGMFGDDKYDFIVAFTKEFNLNKDNFRFDKHGGNFIRKFLFGNRLGNKSLFK